MKSARQARSLPEVSRGKECWMGGVVKDVERGSGSGSI